MLNILNKFLPRATSALKYLSRSDKPWEWKLIRSQCPNCKRGLFISLGKSAFQLRCIFCWANGTNLSLIPVIEKYKSSKKVNSAWEMSTYGATLNYLNKNIREVFATEFFEDHQSGEMINGVLNQDVQKTSFSDCSLDIITSNQVFEHVPDNSKAFLECHRILKPGGVLIFSVPMYDIPSTIKLAKISQGELELLVEPPEFHGSRTTGGNSVLTFWKHSKNDIEKIVSNAGFTTNIIEVCITKYGYHKSKVIYAIKTD